MKLLFDTHAFLFAISNPELLSSRARDLLSDPSNERWVSAVCIWEIAIKIQIGKLELPSDRQYYHHHIRQLGAHPLPVELRHALAVLELPPLHKDPFDRLLVAQAREEGFTLLTRDERIGAYAVETIW